MDLNADLGEGFGTWRLGDDDALLEVVTSANVACGFHAGDAGTMRHVCAGAAERGVTVGAQVGYRDLAGFGRRRIEYAFAELRDEIVYQVGALAAFCRLAGTRIGYVKPHGALYTTAAVEESQAAAVVAAISAYDSKLPVLCAPGSVLAQLATGAGLRVVAEGFADRGYRPDGTLVPRGAPGALITDVDEVVARAVRMARDHTLVAIDGAVLPAPVESICVHGDTPGAVELAGRIRVALADAGLALAPFA
ncbi:LamB/YcsF family protein [Plantactinospora sp. GCM10030261]|uniref:LamB/YcsF family protein n=1 Tax=Plantactinospora sp. GCM10030261 TaxID=3273420 RepID=UPI00361F4D9F